MISCALVIALGIGLGLCLHELAGILTKMIMITLAQKRVERLERKYIKKMKGDN